MGKVRADRVTVRIVPTKRPVGSQPHDAYLFQFWLRDPGHLGKRLCWVVSLCGVVVFVLERWSLDVFCLQLECELGTEQRFL
jgi:hypothetical protein